MSDSNSFFGLFGCLKKTTLNKDENGRTVKDNPLKPMNSRNSGSQKGGKVQPSNATQEIDMILCSECQQPVCETNFATEDFDSKKPTNYTIKSKK